MTKEAAVVKVEFYDQQIVEQAMQELLAHLGPIEKYIQPGDKVLVKPNILEGANKTSEITTHP